VLVAEPSKVFSARRMIFPYWSLGDRRRTEQFDFAILRGRTDIVAFIVGAIFSSAHPPGVTLVKLLRSGVDGVKCGAAVFAVHRSEEGRRSRVGGAWAEGLGPTEAHSCELAYGPLVPPASVPR
jgi:hypothetical protein